jgi:hypothetical protein
LADIEYIKLSQDVDMGEPDGNHRGGDTSDNAGSVPPDISSDGVTISQRAEYRFTANSDRYLRGGALAIVA